MMPSGARGELCERSRQSQRGSLLEQEPGSRPEPVLTMSEPPFELRIIFRTKRRTDTISPNRNSMVILPRFCGTSQSHA